jgi:serine protease Do
VFAEAVNVEGPQVRASPTSYSSRFAGRRFSVRVKSRIEPAVRRRQFQLQLRRPRFRRLAGRSSAEALLPRIRRPGGQLHRPGPIAVATPPFRRHAASRLRPTSQGSGFFISEDGYIVTNNHVVENGSRPSPSCINDGKELEAKLSARTRTDLAVLKVDERQAGKFTYVNFADDAKPRVGDWVVAVGNPFGLGGTVTAGIVSARGRDIGAGPYDDYIQIDAPMNRGNSGGPTFNLNGEVVGINTAIFSPSGGNVGIAFAIPASTSPRT